MNKQGKKSLRDLWFFLTLAARLSPAYMLLLLFNSLVGSAQIIANAVIPKFLIDEIVGAQDPQKLLLFVGLIVASNLLFRLLSNTVKMFLDVKSVFLKEMMRREMARKIMNVEYSYLEDPYYLDLKERSVFAITNQSALENLVNCSASILKSIFTLVGLAALMFSLSWVYVLLLMAAVACSLLINAGFRGYQSTFFEQLLPINRKYGLYVQYFYDDTVQKDARIYNMAGMITDRVTLYNREINTWFSKFYGRQGVFLGLLGIITDLQAALAYGYAGLRVATDFLGPQISIGSFTMYVSAAVNFSSSFIDMGHNATAIGQMLNYLEPFVEFMRLPDQKDVGGTTPFTGPVESVRFENVTFRYPKCDTDVLKNISFDVGKGEKISIVGLNGAGKTTLIKLICRLYKPSGGRIFVNGVDINDYDYLQYVSGIAAVFQDYKLFAYGIDENITCRASGDDAERVNEIIRQVGLERKMQTLPNGVSSLIGKTYSEEGIEMSGGETQKVAIARALYKEASLIILDEPTSALDPLAEAEIYSRFNELVGEKTAFYISHRMSSSVFCDRILIIDNGTVEDYDTHSNLMKKTDSLYYKLFMSQAENYALDS